MFKFLDPTGCTYYKGEAFQYNLPRNGEKWATTMHPEPQEAVDGDPCGPGGLHLMRRLNASYAPSNWWPWWARGAGSFLGCDHEKVRWQGVALRRISPQAFARALRPPFNWGRGAKLNGAYLIRADLHGANLYQANLRWANLCWANLQGADLNGANLREANLYQANLQGANLEGVDLREANLRWANLRWANLYRVNLEEANLEGANLEGANLEGANLEEANLYWAIGISKAGGSQTAEEET